jgi:hypothetical protein
MDHTNSSNTLEDNVNVIDGVAKEKPKSWISHNLEGVKDKIGVLGKKPKTCTSNNSQGRNIDLGNVSLKIPRITSLDP